MMGQKFQVKHNPEDLGYSKLGGNRSIRSRGLYEKKRGSGELRIPIGAFLGKLSNTFSFDIYADLNFDLS